MSERGNFFYTLTWGGALTGGVGALTLTEWMALGGFVLALLGFCVNTWHKIAMYRLERDRSARE